MEVFEHLPQGLRHNFKEAINPTVRCHLEYLWKSAHALSSSPSLSHALSRRLVELGAHHSIHLPEYVNNRLCTSCSAVLLPSITARVRVRPRSRRSKKKCLLKRAEICDDNGQIVSGRRSDETNARSFKNQLVVHCNACGEISTVTACCHRYQKSNSSSSLLTEGNTNTVNSNLSAGQVSTKSTASTSATLARSSADNAVSSGGAPPVPVKAKFSFLKTLDRRVSAPGRMVGDFIPLGQSGTTNTGSFKRNNTVVKSIKPMGRQSAASVTTGPDTAVDTGAQSQEIETVGEIIGENKNKRSAASSSTSTSLSLAELERMKKKEKQKRRKTSDSLSFASATTTTATTASAVLSRSPVRIDGGGISGTNVNDIAGGGSRGSATATASLSSLQTVFKRKL